MNLSWDDLCWDDPDGGSIVLHGIIPTLVYPAQLRPRIDWDGLCLLSSSSEIEVWNEEDNYERDDPGVNLKSAMLAGGITAIYLDELTQLQTLQVGRFPDPEPRRLQRLALGHNRPLFFAEPDLDDAAWGHHLADEATEMTRLTKLLSMLRIGGIWRKCFKKFRKQGVMPENIKSVELMAASVLAATWWTVLQGRSSDKLNEARDLRFAARIRGALANLRQSHGPEPVLLVPMTQIWRYSILESLRTCPPPEEVSCWKASSDEEEE